MSVISSIGTYLPAWGTDAARVVAEDEDSVTLAVAAGRAALAGRDSSAIREVVFVSRSFPLLSGGNSAPLLGGLGLADDIQVRETVGGSPAVLDAITSAGPGTLVIGADVENGAGASAVLCGDSGATIAATGRVVRSLPTTTRDSSGHRTDYADPRLLRERGLNEALTRLGNPKPLAVGGVVGRDIVGLCAGTPPVLVTTGASAIGFALAALAEQQAAGQVLAVEQAAATLADLGPGTITVTRDERPAQRRPDGALAPGASMSISLSAYDRAYDQKLRLEAAKCTSCGTLAFPRRYRCLQCGTENSSEPSALPREAEIYSLATIRVPVPGLVSPYTVVLAELGDSGVRTLVRLTGATPGSVAIGGRGTLVLRLVAVRSGVPDYGYAFLPTTSTISEGAAA